MSNITLEKTHALLENLAEYVMTEVPTRNELQHGLNELRHEMDGVRQEMDGFRQEMMVQLALKADKSDVQRIDKNVEQILQGMDAQAQQLDILRTDMRAVSKTLDFHEERLGTLEEHNFGQRVRENKEDYQKSK